MYYLSGMKKLNKLEQSIYDEFIKLKPELLYTLKSTKKITKHRFIELPFWYVNILHTAKYDIELKKFTLITYPVYKGDDMIHKEIKL